jgi:diguanylate cyclase (GGDEF)-like protein
MSLHAGIWASASAADNGRMRAAASTVDERKVARALAEVAEIEASRMRVRAGLTGRERTVTLLLAAGFVAAAAACAAFVPADRTVSAGSIALFVAVYAAMSQIEFEIGPGSAVPTVLVLVPMLFVLPVGAVPLVAASGLLLGGLFERVRSRRHHERIAVLLCSSWHTVGPTLVLGLLARGPLTWDRVPLYVLALATQLGFDVAAVVTRHGIGRGVAVGQLVRPFGWVAVVDAALAPIAFVVAWAAIDEPLAVLCVLPLASLLHVLSVERKKSIDESLALGRAVADASREARSDPLTGVGNRLAWEESVDAARSRLARTGKPVSVVFVDLDRLKETNDRLGHDAGDRHIRGLAAALAQVVPEESTLARIGGDEFAVLALGLDETGCGDLVRSLRTTLATLEVGSVSVSASIGVAACPPCISLDEALRLADERLYADKADSGVGSTEPRKSGGAGFAGAGAATPSGP